MVHGRSHRRVYGLMLIAGLCLAGGLGGASQDGSPLSIGTLRKMHSEILKEDRTLSVRVPPDYERSRLSYPVIYLLYGDQTEGYFAETVSSLERLEGGAEIPDFIVVGIHNSDRYGDLLPVHFTGRPGGADAFLEFLEKELMPFIESKYRTKPYRLLVGPQAGGPFGLYALACRPALFNAMILENPFSAPASRDVLQTKLREYAAGRPDAKTTVFINSFDRTGFQDHSEANQALKSVLDAFEPTRPAGLRIWRRRLEEPTFVPSLELKQPLRMIFAGFYPPESPAMTGLADVIAYYREAGLRLGFEVDPPAFVLAVKSDDMSRAGRPAAAQEILEYALGLRPYDTNAMYRLGNLMFDSGELNRAEEIFRKLQDLNPDPYFAGRLGAIERMRNGSAAYTLSGVLKKGLPAARAKFAELEKSKDPRIYFDEREFIALGYRLLSQNRIDQAVSVFELNARRYPDSWNAHDSLGEAYMKAGLTKQAIRSYERSLRLNPGNDNAKKMLEALRRSPRPPSREACSKNREGGGLMVNPCLPGDRYGAAAIFVR
jgi:tetratricopeptide (TPR) repeat protein